jgi:hypothetical protein
MAFAFEHALGPGKSFNPFLLRIRFRVRQDLFLNVLEALWIVEYELIQYLN